jgi:hypothetical protein
MTSREEQVLKTRDTSVDDENEWEEFSLIDVKVLIPGKSRYANLLATSPEHPVRVLGCLDEIEEEQAHLGMFTVTLTPAALNACDASAIAVIARMSESTRS